MFRRKLLALNHPNSHSFNVEDNNEFRTMIVWLEDQKIRQYKIEDRAPLRDLNNPDWQKAYNTYLQELGCPYQNAENKEVFDWMLGYAIRLEYGDEVEKFKAVTPQSFSSSSNQAPKGTSSNPLDNLDLDDPDFKAGVTSLAMLLQVPPYHDHLEQLKAVCILVREKLSKEVLTRQAKSQAKNEFIPIDKTELGFDTGEDDFPKALWCKEKLLVTNYIINEAAKILRLLHLRDLRELQTQINQAIVAVQTITANPKTDSRLGKVGRM